MEKFGVVKGNFRELKRRHEKMLEAGKKMDEKFHGPMIINTHGWSHSQPMPPFTAPVRAVVRTGYCSSSKGYVETCLRK